MFVSCKLSQVLFEIMNFYHFYRISRSLNKITVVTCSDYLLLHLFKVILVSGQINHSDLFDILHTFTYSTLSIIHLDPRVFSNVCVYVYRLIYPHFVCRVFSRMRRFIFHHRHPGSQFNSYKLIFYVKNRSYPIVDGTLTQW